jgi:hypothetical protein
MERFGRSMKKRRDDAGARARGARAVFTRAVHRVPAGFNNPSTHGSDQPVG